MAERRQCERATPPWWALAVGLAAALKLHFSAAAATELAWMLRPLAGLLRTAAGWQFLRNVAGEWECPDAGIVLVKACAGINFMVLALLGWCWALRPGGALRRARAGGSLAADLGWLAVALAGAWATALLVNAVRILVIVRWQPVLGRWLEPQDAHRLLGLLVYLPALSLLWVVADRERPVRGLAIGLGLYAGLMLVLPLLGGAAVARPRELIRHLLWTAAVLAPLAALALAMRRGFPGPAENRQDGSSTDRSPAPCRRHASP